jgi:hypothetical protein
MLRCCIFAALAVPCLVAMAFAGGGGVSSQDPNMLVAGFGEPTFSLATPQGYRGTSGKALISPALSAPSTTAIIITTWQSNIQSAALGTYTTTNATANNFNIYDGGLYSCVNPIVGAPYPEYLGSNSANCQIADALINAGTYTQVIMVPMAIGGSICSDWAPGGALYQRIVVTMNRLKARGYTAATGFTGHMWILPHGGETDGVVGTARATLATCIRAFAQAFVDNGAPTSARFFVPTESMVTNATNSTVTNAQADAVASGCATCRAGANVDSLTGGTNRQADGTHLMQTGAASLAALDVAVIQACKLTTC